MPPASARTKNGTALITVWDAENGKTIRQFEQADREVTAIALSPDGRLLAAGDEQGRLALWTLPEVGQSRWLRPVHRGSTAWHFAAGTSAGQGNSIRTGPPAGWSPVAMRRAESRCGILVVVHRGLIVPAPLRHRSARLLPRWHDAGFDRPGEHHAMGHRHGTSAPRGAVQRQHHRSGDQSRRPETGLQHASGAASAGPGPRRAAGLGLGVRTGHGNLRGLESPSRIPRSSSATAAAGSPPCGSIGASRSGIVKQDFCSPS